MVLFFELVCGSKVPKGKNKNRISTLNLHLTSESLLGGLNIQDNEDHGRS